MNDHFMTSRYPIITIIATSGCRTGALLQQAIPSVLAQDCLPCACIVVDDNNAPVEYSKIGLGLQELQKGTAVELRLIQNNRTPGFSGTGAWNTAIAYARKYTSKHHWEDVYLAILDDDDRWHSCHLRRCAEGMYSKPDAIFCNLTRAYHEHEESGKLKSHSDLTIPKFLYGNPGVQGSNMCFRLSVIEAIGGFDETLRSCTDRDLMIRFLEQFGNNNVVVVDEQTVWHDARSPACVTNNIENKTAGLDTFYKKHLWRFDEQTLESSLTRAEKLFSYPHKQQIWESYYQAQEIIAVMMPLHNGSKSIRRAVHSVVTQECTERPIVLFIGDDTSTDNWRTEISDYLCRYHNIITIDINGGSPAKARNSLAEYILRAYPHAYILCRLDADDELHSTTTISEIEHLFTNDKVEAVLCGNYQMQGGRIVGTNRASTDFHNSKYMRERLLSMSQGDFAAELPSCNLCLRPSIYSPYPDECSGEDHWLLIQLLLLLPRHVFLMASQQMYCMYSLDGKATQLNKVNDSYIDSRKRLYEYYINSIDG